MLLHTPDLAPLSILALSALLALALLCAAALKGWQGWLALKTRELDRPAAPAGGLSDGPLATPTRIDLADIKERIRKLEAIAAGVDL